MTKRRYQCSFALCLGIVTRAFAGSSLMDASGNLRLNSVSDATSDGGVITLISSPGTSSSLLKETSDALSFESGTPATLTCRGATLTDDEQGQVSLATSALVAGSIVLDGIVAGDIEAGLRESRHGRTLFAIFRARLCLDGVDETETEGATLPSKQTLVLPVLADAVAEDKVSGDVLAVFSAAALESGSNLAFGDLYDLKIRAYADPEEIRSMAAEEAASKEVTGSLSAALTKAYGKAKVSLKGPDTSPAVAQGMVVVGQVYSKQSRTVRAKLASWKARVTRGLVVDGFGAESEALLERVLKAFDSETIMASGLPLVAAYRREQRSKLQSLLESGIVEAFEGQIENLEKKTLKRLNAQLLKTIDQPVETAMDSNAAALRNEAFAFEAEAEKLEVPSLGLSKTKVVREMSGKLNDALMTYQDSPAAKIKRAAGVKTVTSKDRKPGQRAIDLGLDLVAVLRPDGFGSLQGFAGYQLGGNMLTFGVHNDADDPQVIAQFGGVRPPLLRVQPKIRFDVDL